jgi:hypothetical protein
MVVEYNSTIADLTCTGANLKSGNPSGFHLTYGVSATSNTYKAFEVDTSLDDGSGTARKISCQFKNGATAQATAGLHGWTVEFIPANYYVTNDGNIVLDIEKSANLDTARTGFGGPKKVKTYWG